MFVLGGGAVEFFFVLSGFLFTFMILREKQNEGRLNFNRFYVRRALRTWPLYFLLVIAAYLIPYQYAEYSGLHMVSGGYYPSWKHSLLFLENYKMIQHDNFPMITPLPIVWSLCIQEHFYFIYPLLLILLPKKWLKWFLIVSIPVAIVSRWVYPIIFDLHLISANDLVTNFDLYAIGGLLGYLCFFHFNKTIALSRKIGTFGKIIICIVVFTLGKFDHSIEAIPFFGPLFLNTILAVGFTALLFVFVDPQTKFRIGDKHIFSQLGRISYGLYLFHIIFNHVLLQYCMIHGFDLSYTPAYLLYASLSLSLTIGISLLSYHLFEKRVLALSPFLTRVFSKFLKRSRKKSSVSG
jgi:peptidoglycan/LPS O-acetylase OafA/YrhL